MVVIVDILANIVWVGYVFCAFKASFQLLPEALCHSSPLLHQDQLSPPLHILQDQHQHHPQLLQSDLPHLSYSPHQQYLSTSSLLTSYTPESSTTSNHSTTSSTRPMWCCSTSTTMSSLSSTSTTYSSSSQTTSFTLDQPLHHSISFEYVIIVWHCGELWRHSSMHHHHNDLMTTTPFLS